MLAQDQTHKVTYIHCHEPFFFFYVVEWDGWINGYLLETEDWE